MLQVLGDVLQISDSNAYESMLTHFFQEWAAASRPSMPLEIFLTPMLTTEDGRGEHSSFGIVVARTVFQLEQSTYKSLQFSSKFCFTLAKIRLPASSKLDEDGAAATGVASSGTTSARGVKETLDSRKSRRRSSFKHTQQMWSEIRANLKNVNIKKGMSMNVNADVLLSCGGNSVSSGGGSSSRGAVVFTCGHAFETKEFHTHVLPRFEQQVMERLDPKLPVTVQAIVHEYKTSVQLPCPKCLFRKLIQV